MHELSIVLSIVDIAEQQVALNDAQSVEEIELEIGQLAGSNETYRSGKKLQKADHHRRQGQVPGVRPRLFSAHAVHRVSVVRKFFFRSFERERTSGEVAYPHLVCGYPG